MITKLLLSLFTLYMGCGVVFSIPFALFGAGRIDPHAQRGSWGFRVIIIPGTVFLWPLLAHRWRKGQ